MIEAMVSRATACRYFPQVDALLLEAALDVATPDAEMLFEGSPREDAVARVKWVDEALHDMVLANEAQLRMMLVHSLQRGIGDSGDDAVPARQNRRSPLIEAALAPACKQFKPAALKQLMHALALVVGTEAMAVCKDVLQLDDAESRKVKRRAIRAPA